VNSHSVEIKRGRRDRGSRGLKGEEEVGELGDEAKEEDPRYGPEDIRGLIEFTISPDQPTRHKVVLVGRLVFGPDSVYTTISAAAPPVSDVP